MDTVIEFLNSLSPVQIRLLLTGLMGLCAFIGFCQLKDACSGGTANVEAVFLTVVAALFLVVVFGGMIYWIWI
jgi:hypothetical protein